ncbi:MAG: MFS transporter, partial [Clostridia bacterium]|nr:MFS transporter [Clostridia bacterium]
DDYIKLGEKFVRVLFLKDYTFSIGTIGRDAACAGLFMGNILNYVYFTKKLDASQLAVLTVVMAIARIFDAFNDPVMGNIIDATKSRFGKFKPWIAIGMVSSAVVVYFSFSNNLQGWAYVTFFSLMYFAFSITFTMNDIAYWGMIPSLARNAKDRDKLTSLTVFCAGLGAGICGILLPILTTGDLAIGGSAVSAYRVTAVMFVAIFIVLQSVTLIGVKEDHSHASPTEKVSLKGIIQTYKKNDQLRWISLAFFCTQFIPTAALTMYIYFQFGYNGTLLTLFYTFSSFGSIAVNLLYPKLSQRYSRAGLIKLSWISMIIGGTGLLALGILFPNDTFSFTIPFFNATITLKYFLMALLYFFIGFAQTATYMSHMVCIANTTEYNDYKFGKRSEGMIFASRPFITKLGNAINTLLVMLFYIIIGINRETNKIADLEQQANIGTITADQKLDSIGQLIAAIEPFKVYALLALVVFCTVGTFTIAYFIFKKKYFIDEAYFDKMTQAIAQRDGEQQEQTIQAESEIENEEE